jgi:hypothetical protein
VHRSRASTSGITELVQDLARTGHYSWVTSEAELTHISSLLHDEWFDLDAMVRDPQSAEVRIRVYPSRRRKGRWRIWGERAPVAPLPEPIGDLVIRRVVDVQVNDAAGIGWFDVGGIAYDQTVSCVTLRSNFPLEIMVRVEALEVELRSPQ